MLVQLAFWSQPCTPVMHSSTSTEKGNTRHLFILVSVFNIYQFRMKRQKIGVGRPFGDQEFTQSMQSIKYWECLGTRLAIQQLERTQALCDTFACRHQQGVQMSSVCALDQSSFLKLYTPLAVDRCFSPANGPQRLQTCCVLVFEAFRFRFLSSSLVIVSPHSHFSCLSLSALKWPWWQPSTLCEAIGRFRSIATLATPTLFFGSCGYCRVAIFRVHAAERQAMLLTLWKDLRSVEKVGVLTLRSCAFLHPYALQWSCT